jgi:Protein of unknown function (DUF938)
MTSSEAKQYAPATQRNREPILSVLQQHLPPTGLVLEIASGSGEHAAFFSPQLAPRLWLPSDIGELQLKSIEAWRQDRVSPELLPPIYLNVMEKGWPHRVIQSLSGSDKQTHTLSAIVSINMIHIAPWAATEGLFAGSEILLPQGGTLYLYGPYQMGGKHTAPSNEAFDEMLRLQNPAWGIRPLETVIDLAERHNLRWRETIAMPANNLSVIFERESS